MKKFLFIAIFGLVGLAASAFGSCTVIWISLLSTDGTHKTFAGELDNTSGVNILQHNFIVAFLDSGNNVVETKTVPGCLRSVQNNQSDYFSAVSTTAAAGISTGLARIAFDSTFKVGTTSAQDVTISALTANRIDTVLTVKGTVTSCADADDSCTLIVTVPTVSLTSWLPVVNSTVGSCTVMLILSISRPSEVCGLEPSG